MLHKDALKISYQHRYKIKTVFKEVLGIYDIHHFSLDLIDPSGKMVFLSANPSHGYEICARGYVPFYGPILPDYYQTYEFYWWRDVRHKAYAEQIEHIHSKHGFRHGFMMVRHWNDFYLVYSYATRSDDLHFTSLVVNKLNELFGLGDHIYNEMRQVYSEYTEEARPPYIDRFYPFQGGVPMARYSDDYVRSESGILLKEQAPIQQPAARLRLIVNH